MKQNITGYYIKRINDYIEAEANRELEQYGLTYMQARVLSFLIERQDIATIHKDIEDFFGIKHPTVIGVLQRMEAKGLIVTTVDPQDKRQRIITMTDHALELTTKIRDHVSDFEKDMVEGLSDEEIDTVKRLLHKVYKNITKKDNKEKG